MKKIFLLLLITFCFNSCSNDDDNETISELEKLPPVTQVGANKIGCLLDGKAFLPEDRPNAIVCFYEYDNDEYYFGISYRNTLANNKVIGIDFGASSKQIFQGETYQLTEYMPNNTAGAYYNNDSRETFTDNEHTGALSITRLDLENKIVSGTFWYDVVDTDGILHHIREGRFDMKFTN